MQTKGKKNATINRGITGLKQALNLAGKEGMLITIPHFPILKEDNARQGFFERHEFEAVAISLPSPLDEIARFAYYSGWLKGEIVPLRWNQVDRLAREVRIPTSKNGHGRVLPLEGELWDLPERRWQAREVNFSNGETFLSSGFSSKWGGCGKLQESLECRLQKSWIPRKVIS